jgi:hypothetical protein
MRAEENVPVRVAHPDELAGGKFWPIHLQPEISAISNNCNDFGGQLDFQLIPGNFLSDWKFQISAAARNSGAATLQCQTWTISA